MTVSEALWAQTWILAVPSLALASVVLMLLPIGANEPRVPRWATSALVVATSLMLLSATAAVWTAVIV